MHVITGATGLAGSHLLHSLRKRGADVRALKRPDSSLEPARRLFAGEAHLLEGVEWINADVLDVTALRDAFSGAENVYHCAAFVSFVPSELKQMVRVNVDGTANVVNACLDLNVRKLCHMSSVSAIDRTSENELIHEDVPWKVNRENSNYAISKQSAEREVWRGLAEGLDVVIVNPSIILGPGDWRRSSDAIFQKIWSGLHFYTDGTTGWVDARDVAGCMIALMEGPVSGQRFIVSAENLPYRTVFEWAAEDLGRPAPSVRANRLLRGIAWRAEALKSALWRSRPLITRETAIAAGKKVRFSNEKVKAATGHDFIRIRESVKRTCKMFLSEMSK